MIAHRYKIIFIFENKQKDLKKNLWTCNGAGSDRVWQNNNRFLMIVSTLYYIKTRVTGLAC